MKEIRTPKSVFFFVIFIGCWVMLNMLLQISHQLSDVEFKASMMHSLSSIVIDIFVNHSIFELLFNGVIGFTCLIMLWRLGKQIYLNWEWNKFFHKRKHNSLTNRLNERYHTVGTSILVVRDSSLIALSMGWFRPRVIISTGVLNEINEKELEAVLYHEFYHCKKFDPLKLFLLTLVMDGMRYIPIIKGFVNYYKIWKELCADRYAIHQMGSVIALGDALLKLINKTKQSPEVGVHFGNTALSYRIKQIVEPDQKIHVPLVNFKSLTGSAVALLSMFLVVLVNCMG